LTGRLVTEIITIRSLQELNGQIEAEIDSYLSQKEEYSERLGNFLREAEEKYGDEDWFKQLSLDKLGGGGKSRQKKNEKKKKKGKKESDDWVPFQGLELSSSIQGEAEVMFEAIAKITERLEGLTDAKESIEELRKVGLGNDVRYICYLENGIVRKVVIKPIGEDTAGKFTFNRGFTVIQAIQP
jgi:hypothetical protein